MSVSCSKVVLSRRHILAIGPPQPKFSLKKKYNKNPRKVQHGKSLTLCMAQHQKVILAKGEPSSTHHGVSQGNVVLHHLGAGGAP